MKSETPVFKDLVLVGGGHSHVAVLKMLGMNPVPGLGITVISREIHAPYSGMLPGFVAGHYDFDEAHIDLRPLCQFAGARLIQDTVRGLDLENRRIECASRPDVSFDILSINIGSSPDSSVPGATEHAIPVKPVSGFLAHWEEVVARLPETAEDEPFRIVVVGGGAGGCELTLAMQHRLDAMAEEAGIGADRIDYTLVSGADHLLPGHRNSAGTRIAKILRERGVELRLGERVERVEETTAHTDSGDAIAFDALMWVTDAAPAPWLAETGLATTEEGFIAVDDYLRSTSHPFVFAAGDVATMVNHPRPKSGVFAVRQGPPLAENLRRAAQNKGMKPFRPQREHLALIGTGGPYAIGSRGRISFEGAWVWRLKKWIDTRWMEQWRDLPMMEADVPKIGVHVDGDALQEISAIAMRCGGCGAKVGASVLTRVLDRLEVTDRDDVLVGLDSPDDCAVLSVPEGLVSIQSVDYFRAFVDDPYVFGRIAANHALGDLWAMGAEPQAALALATIPYGPEGKVEETLFQLMSGALEILTESGASLVGGHTSEGSEMAFGLQVSGLGDPDRLMKKGGMRPGDAIVLTRPIGTGTLFAADMRQQAKGRWIAAALESMMQPNAAAAKTLLDHGATACTDVTGFGLLGHLVEMTKASGTDATLLLDEIPVLDGALETVAAGIFSSLQPQNVRLRRGIRNQEEAASHPKYPLIFDPQTAGGLLASVPAGAVDASLQALHEAGYPHACVIGHVEERGEALEPVVLKS